ncbi:MAG: diaminopimelate decarboxylase [Peptostreptococcaceae bacterium]|nr:diaminopimelate decarboxylase [Peptostreptococcaceae bacterium]
MKLHGNMSIKNNTLYIGGISCVDLANKYSTPLYVFDEDLIRENCREYRKYFKVEENNNKVAYAGKAFLTLYMCNLIKEENLCLDVVSGGELYTAHKANFPMENILFHGNNKTIDEIKMGIELGVGRFVVDNFYELDIIEEICKGKNKIQEIYFRITPGIEAHTHDYIKTGQIDSKFGFALINGDLYEAIEKLSEYKNIKLVGLHAHIGSQIFDIEPFMDEVDIMIDLIKEIKDKFDIDLKEIDLGGGIGVYYTKEDKPKTIKEFCEAIINRAEIKCKEIGIEIPTLIIEPGRSISANAGSTLYTIGSIKDIKNVRTYVSVDGGMTDNIRPSLYKAGYECSIVNKMKYEKVNNVTVAGKCCESGDILITHANIMDIESGDILITASTGAYGYSMASNYNKIPKPAVVMVSNGESNLVCKRQTYDELLELELI